jgi:hypothetical protein
VLADRQSNNPAGGKDARHDKLSMSLPTLNAAAWRGMPHRVVVGVRRQF